MTSDAAQSNPNIDLDERKSESELPVAVIRTSDRMLFKRCRRKWYWGSHMRKNLERKGSQPSPFWTGTGFHFAMEDFHGENRYGHPSEAFRAYLEASHSAAASAGQDPLNSSALSANWKADSDLGVSMLDYYADVWLKSRDPLTTYVHDGRICCEVNFEIPLPVDKELLLRHGYRKAVFAGTIDRVSIDEWGQLWIVEYKTAAALQSGHFLTDSQISGYIFAGIHLFNKPVAGVIYQQHWKSYPTEPLILANGKVSVNKQQKTSRPLYKEVLEAIYGEVNKAPASNIDMLNYLAQQEDENRDRYIRRDFLGRNEQTANAEGIKMIMEAEDMTNPGLSLYPNSTRDCSWDCPFQSPCVSLDDGSDFEYELEVNYQPSRGREDTWRKHLKPPSQKESSQ